MPKKYNLRHGLNIHKNIQARLARDESIAKTRGSNEKEYYHNRGEVRSYLVCDLPLQFDKAHAIANQCPNAVVGGKRYAEWAAPARVDIQRVAANIEQYNIFMRAAFICQLTRRTKNPNMPFRGYVVKEVNKNGVHILGSGHVMFSMYYKMDREDRRPFARCLEMVVFERTKSLMTFEERWGLEDEEVDAWAEKESMYSSDEFSPDDPEGWDHNRKLNEDRERQAMGLPPIHNLEDI